MATTSRTSATVGTLVGEIILRLGSMFANAVAIYDLTTQRTHVFLDIVLLLIFVPAFLGSILDD